MKEYIYKLKFKYRVKNIPIRAYTLFGAFCNAYKELYGELDFLDNFTENKNIPFVISSLFPYYKKTLFFPLPFQSIIPDKNDLKKLKILKKIKYISLNLFNKIISGEFKIEDFFNIFIEQNNKITARSDYNIINNIYLCETKEIDGKIDIVSNSIIVRNKQAKFIGDEATRFERNFSFFNANSGLFFLVKFPDEKFITKFEATFRLLEDFGIGGMRNIGVGSFKIDEINEFNNIKKVSDAKGFIALSPFYPSEEDIENVQQSDSYYKIESVRLKAVDWSNKQLWKPKMSFFIEGSNFGYIPQKEYNGKSLYFYKEVIQYGLSYNILRK